MGVPIFELNRAEVRKLREIAAGKCTPSNDPHEDSLIKKGLIKESMLVFSNENGSFSSDVRGIVITDHGVEVLKEYMKEKKSTHQFCITLIFELIALIIAVLGILIPIIYSANT